MVEEEWMRIYGEVPSRRRPLPMPSFSSALLEAISNSTDVHNSPHSPKKPHQIEQLVPESPSLNTSTWLYSPEMTHSRRPLRRSMDDFRLSHRQLMRQEPPLSSKKQIKVKPMSPGSKLASFLNSLFTPRKCHYPKHDYEKEKATFSHSASMRSRSASQTPSSADVYKRYDSSVDESLYSKPKPFSVSNRPSKAKPQSHKSVAFCPPNVLLDENYNRLENENISKDEKNCSLWKQHGIVEVLYEEEEDVGSYSSSDLFELENLNGVDMDLPVFGTTHLEANKAFAKGLPR